MTANIKPIQVLPDWVPSVVRLYLSHTEEGQSLRALARAEGVHASTVMRQVRRFESKRDDPLVEQALAHLRQQGMLPDESDTILAEAARVLPIMRDKDAVLVAAADMDKAVILREGPEGTQRLAVLDTAVAEVFALRDWIACTHRGRASRYELTAEGRQQADADSTRIMGPRDPDDARGTRPVTVEPPVVVLSRRRDADGVPFLTSAQVRAASQLFEAFAISGFGAELASTWPKACQEMAQRSGAAVAPRQRARLLLLGALERLGPGLADVVLRCCCLRQGLETAERELGWSARSGKVVLRIALTQLDQFLSEQDQSLAMIG